jgi:hypothetical protein
MRDTNAERDDGFGQEPRMTLLAVGGGYWLYEGEDFLNDMLFGRGAYPFRIRCMMFRDAFELRAVFGETFSVATLWRINPDVIERLRRENLLIEVSPSDAA